MRVRKPSHTGDLSFLSLSSHLANSNSFFVSLEWYYEGTYWTFRCGLSDEVSLDSSGQKNLFKFFLSQAKSMSTPHDKRFFKKRHFSVCHVKENIYLRFFSVWLEEADFHFVITSIASVWPSSFSLSLASKSSPLQITFCPLDQRRHLHHNHQHGHHITETYSFWNI